MTFAKSHLAILPLMISLAACRDLGANKVATDAGSMGQPTPSSVYPQPANPNCTIQLQSMTNPIRMIFVVDTSGSNHSNSGGFVGYVGTDDNKIIRGNSIGKFFDAHKNNGSYAWSLITFGETTAKTLLPLSDLAADMLAAINQFMAITDTGNTPYMAALDATQAVISSDSNSATANTKYVVVFISDGLPNPSVTVATLQSKIAAISGLHNSTTFNAVYYGASSTASSDLMQQMANSGGGKFTDLSGNSSGAFDVASVIAIPGTACQ